MNTQLEIRLFDALKTIASGYQSAERIKRNAQREYGIDGDEALEYAYENIQELAKRTIKGVRIKRHP